jgi:TolA-binding protein
LAAAQRAHDFGLPLLAADLFRQLREQPGADRAALGRALASALLDGGRPEEAEKVLAELPEPRGAAWHLRAALAAVQLRKLEAARAASAAITEGQLPAADLPWYWFLQGELLDLAPVQDLRGANAFYVRAEESAATDVARARFQLAAERVRLLLGSADVKALRTNFEKFQGTPTGYTNALYYAAALDASGQKSLAVATLQSVLVGLPRQEREAWDKVRLVLGIIGDKSRSGAGRNALVQLIESGHDPLRQRQALQILAAESAVEPERRQFRELLKKLAEAKPDHPIKESALFFRAQLALAERDFGAAEEDANALLKAFPLSPLRAHALGVLTQSAWEQRRYRLAADLAQKTRTELQAVAAPPAPGRPAGPVPRVVAASRARADLSVLEAEAWYRAGQAAGDRGDFRSAADAYAAVVRERPAEFDAARIATLMFQRVMAEIQAGAANAGQVIDDYARDPAFDPETRWQAEWSLARALQLQGADGVKEASARIDRLIAGAPAEAGALKPGLRGRMAWLQAQLTLENGDAPRTIELVEKLEATPPAIDGALKDEIASRAVLLKARAELSLGREPAALETMKRLRENFRKSDAAVSSYLIEAEYFSDREKIDEARKKLVELTDNPDYATHPQVPYALYRLALLAERLGRKESLEEGYRRLEQLVTSPAAAGQADLVFMARMRQGGLLRQLNDFSGARRTYEELVNRYPRRPDVVYAQLALAECYNALSSDDDKDRLHAEAAMRLFEQLRDRESAPRDVRVEAGYNLGLLLVRRGKPEDAARVWWNDVIVPFLQDETKAFESDAKRPSWLARTLLDLGDLQQKLGRWEDAKATYRLLLDKRLPYGEAVARGRLEQLGAGTPKATP